MRKVKQERPVMPRAAPTKRAGKLPCGADPDPTRGVQKPCKMRIPPRLHLYIGAPGSGKTHLASYFLGRSVAKGAINHFLVIASTASNGQFAQFPRKFVKEKYSNSHITNMIAIAKKQIEEKRAELSEDARAELEKSMAEAKKQAKRLGLGEDEIEIDDDPNIDDRLVPDAAGGLLFDDGSSEFPFHTAIFDQLNTRFRHWNIWLFYLIQNAVKLPVSFYDYATDIFVFRQANKHYISTLYERVGGTMSFDEFAAALEEATSRPNGCLHWQRNPPEGEAQLVATVAPADNLTKTARFYKQTPKK